MTKWTRPNVPAHQSVQKKRINFNLQVRRCLVRKARQAIS